MLALVLVAAACGDANDDRRAASRGNLPRGAALPVPPGFPTPEDPSPASRDFDIEDFQTTTTGATSTPTAPPTTKPTGGGTAGQLLGAWHSDIVDDEYGQVVTDLAIYDGTFVETVSIPAAYYFFYMTGPYEVYEDQGIVRFKIDEYYPTEWCGPIDCVEIHMPDYETNLYTFLDPNTLRLESDPCEFAPDCAVTYQRL